jgi:hypothetical protein
MQLSVVCLIRGLMAKEIAVRARVVETLIALV